MNNLQSGIINANQQSMLGMNQAEALCNMGAPQAIGAGLFGLSMASEWKPPIDLSSNFRQYMRECDLVIGVDRLELDLSLTDEEVK